MLLYEIRLDMTPVSSALSFLGAQLSTSSFSDSKSDRAPVVSTKVDPKLRELIMNHVIKVSHIDISSSDLKAYYKSDEEKASVEAEMRKVAKLTSELMETFSSSVIHDQSLTPLAKVSISDKANIEEMLADIEKTWKREFSSSDFAQRVENYLEAKKDEKEKLYVAITEPKMTKVYAKTQAQNLHAVCESLAARDALPEDYKRYASEMRLFVSILHHIDSQVQLIIRLL